MNYKKLLLGLVFLNAFFINAQTAVNKLDADGKKDGLWKGIYAESKRPRYEGTFSHGKETGVFKFFDDTKKGDVLATEVRILFFTIRVKIK
jgi:antitoxin component YwqK of YwqJK toxin-antitoxin module